MPKRKRTKSLKSLKAKCWHLFSEYIRRRDGDGWGTVECFTCGKLMYWKEAQAGHAIGGRHNAVLFDSEICRPQCPRCNVFLRGNYPIFTTKLIKENGMEWWEKKLQGSTAIVKYNRSDIEDIISNLKDELDYLDNVSPDNS